MSDVKILGSAMAKVVPIQQSKNAFTINDFFSFYGSDTHSVMISFLDATYNEYLKTEAWSNCTIREKVFVEFNYLLLRKLLVNLKR